MNQVVNTEFTCPKALVRQMDKLIKKDKALSEQAALYLQDMKCKYHSLDDLLDSCYRVALWSHKQQKMALTEKLVSFIIEKNPDYYPAYLVRTSLHEYKKNIQLAYDDLTVYLAFDGNDMSLVRRAVELSLQLKLENDAWQLLNHLLTHLPDDIWAIDKLGGICYRQNKLEHAEQLFARAVQLGAQDPAIINNYGATLEANDKHEQAVIAFKAAIELSPDNIQYHNNLTHAYVDLEDLESAIASAEAALAIDSLDGTSLFNRAVLYEQYSEIEMARAYYEKALQRDPSLKHAYRNLSFVYFEMGQYERGRDLAEKGLALYPNYLNIGVNLAFNYFMLEDWENGYKYYGYRAIKNRIIDIPAWHGESLNGKKLLIWNEQGIGDQFMFAWCFQYLSQLNVDCVIEMDRRLIDLMQHSFPMFRFIAEDSLSREQVQAENFDFMTVQASLGELFQEAIHAERKQVLQSYNSLYEHHSGFIKTLYKYDKLWQSNMKGLKTSRPKVGICWRSGLVTAVRKRNFLEPEDMVAIFDGLDVDVVNLQYGAQPEELEVLESAQRVNFIDFKSIDLKDDQTQLASLINNLDLVVSHSTAVHSLAGGLGVPTWNFIVSHSEREEPFVHPFAGMFRSVKYIETRGQFLKSVVPMVRKALIDWLDNKM